MKDIKPFLTYEEQVNHLMAQGLYIGDRKYAVNVLSTVNYYRLINAYALGLYTDKTKAEFKEGTTFQQIYSLYQFDAILRHIMTELLESFEIMFRTKLAYYIGKHYGSLGYMDAANFANAEYHKEFMDKLVQEKKDRKKSPIVKHHNHEYGGEMPIWATVEILTFGSFSKLYSNLKDSDQNTIAQQLHTSPQYLVSWLFSFVEVRNICAHYGRLYNMPLVFPPRMYPECKHINNRRIFAVLYTLKRFTPEEQWETLMLRLRTALKRYPAVNLEYIGFPQDWENLLGLSEAN